VTTILNGAEDSPQRPRDGAHRQSRRSFINGAGDTPQRPRHGAPGSLQRSSGAGRRVQLSQSALSDILRHAREEAPNECCGLLVGDAHRIGRAVRARNLEASPTRYLIDPADHFAAIRAARAAGHAVVGAYHSHVNAMAVPSETDVAESTGEADFVHLIVSVARLHQSYGGQAGGVSEDAVRAYRFTKDGFEPVGLELTA